MAVALDYIHAYKLPRAIVRARSFTPAAEVVDPSGAAVTLSAGTYSLYAGSRLIFSTSALTYLPVGMVSTTAPIDASVTADEALAENWLETWDVTIDGADVRTFDRPVHLVRRELHPTLTDIDLIARHSDLAELRDTDQPTYEIQRTDAWIRLADWLISKGSRPWLIIDDWKLRETHRNLTLEAIFNDFASSVGDGRYRELADFYRLAAVESFDSLALTYDFSEDGFVQEDEENAKTANPVTTLQIPWGWW